MERVAEDLADGLVENATDGNSSQPQPQSILLQHQQLPNLKESHAHLIDQVLSGSLKFTDLQHLADRSTARIDDNSAGPADYDDIAALTQTHRKTRTRMKRSQLSKDLEGIMGQANHEYVQGNLEATIRLCEEVIKKAPFVPDPYTTLAIVYEEQGKLKQALAWRKLESACLPKSDVNWMHLADLSAQCGDNIETIFFYEEAIKSGVIDVGVQNALVQLYLNVKNRRKALDTLGEILRKEADNLQAWESCARFAEGDSSASLNGAIELMLSSYAECKEKHISPRHIKILTLFLSRVGKHMDALKVLCDGLSTIAHIDTNSIDFQPMRQTNGAEIKTLFNNLIPVSLDIDSQIQLADLHLRVSQSGINIAIAILERLKTLKIEDNFGTFMKVVDTYYNRQQYQHALVFCDLIVAVPIFNLPVMWYKKALCLKEQGKYSDASSLLRRVLGEMPSHAPALSLLDELNLLLKSTKSAKTRDAKRKSINAIVGVTPNKRPRSSQGLHTASIVDDFTRFMELVNEPATRDGALEIGVKLCCCLARIPRMRRKRAAERREMDDVSGEVSFKCPELPCFVQVVFFATRQQIIYSKDNDGIQYIFDYSKMSDEEWFLILTKTCELLCLRAQNEAGLAIVHEVLGSIWEPGQRIRNAVTWIKVFCAVKAGYVDEAKRTCQRLGTEMPQSIRVWNAFHELVMTLETDIATNAHNIYRVQRRLLQREKTCLPLNILIGNYHLEAGRSSGLAAASFAKAYNLRPNDSLICLLTGVAYLKLVMQKRITDRHLVAIQAFSFIFRYFDLAGGWQSMEACFNVGRAYHQLEQFTIALKFYEQALELGSSISSEEADLRSKTLTQTAYNASLIYRHSGADHLAAQVLRQHCSHS